MHIITMLFLLSILILVHELGHFSVARMLGIKVDRFGFGLPFGPTLYETKWKDVTVCVHAFLLGGYVSFPDDDPDSDLPEDDYKRISNRPIWQRFCVVSAGVVANAITAYVLVFLVAIFSHGIPSGKYDIYAQDLQTDKTLSANHIGIKKGDKIVKTNGIQIDSPAKFKIIAQRSKKFDGYVVDKNIQMQLNQIKLHNPSLSTLKPDEIISKGTVISLLKAQDEPKIELNDKLTNNPNNYVPVGKKLNETQIDLRDKLENQTSYKTEGSITLNDLATATADTVHPVSITVERNKQIIDLPIAYSNKAGLIGIKLRIEEIKIPTGNLLSAFSGSWSYLSQNTYLMVTGLIALFTGQVQMQDLHGIVAITKVGSDIIQNKGIWDGLLLTALISMDLAIVNLFPIPALDGGHLVFLLIEKIIGKPVNKDTQENFAKVGFIFLIGLMVFIIFNDIFALVTDKL